MRDLETDVLVLGAGAAGMGAASGARGKGARVVLAERLENPGGILTQCIHNGFGLHWFKEELTGPEYARALEAQLAPDIEILGQCFLLDRDPHHRRFTFAGPQGVTRVTCGSFVYAAGARERPFGSLLIPGDRVSGIYTAGVAQRLVNRDNRRPGNRVLILGSGDIGLIMARRLTLEGMEVIGVLERMPWPGGLERNLQQCLRDFSIPLHLSTTIAEVRGRGRLEEVTTVRVDSRFNPIRGTERIFGVDTLVLSVGLVPSTTPVMGLIRLDPQTRGAVTDNLGRTSRDWIFAAGNCVGIYDLADWVTALGKVAGEQAAGSSSQQSIPPLNIKKGQGIATVLPAHWVPGTDLDLYIRTSRVHEMAVICLKADGKVVAKGRMHPHSPGEMEVLKIRSDQLGDPREIEVEVEDGN